jgi:hypothetical protein
VSEDIQVYKRPKSHNSDLMRQIFNKAYTRKKKVHLLVMPVRRQKSMGYHTIGRLAMGSRAFGFSSGFDVNVGNEEPGPHRMRACSPVEAIDKA